jgi:hypothetical protein
MSIDIIKMVSEFTHKNITLPHALDVLRGANTKGIRDAGHNNLAAYNSCNQLSKIGKCTEEKLNDELYLSFEFAALKPMLSDLI